MEIHLGIQSNCSEIVTQICGVTKELAEEMKRRFKEALSSKYTEDYLNEYAERKFDVPGKYCLGLYEFDGYQMEDWQTIKDIAIEMGLVTCITGFCSEPVSDDEGMEQYVYKKENRKNG